MYSDNSFFSTFTLVTSSTGLPPPSSTAALGHGTNSNNGGVGQLNSAYAAVTGSHHQPQPQIHYLQLPSRISQHQHQQRETRTMSSRSANHQNHHRARSRPYNIVKPIQKRVERARRDSISASSLSPHRSSSARTGGGARTPNLYIDQQQERPSGSTPLSSSGQTHTPLANFEASFDGIASLGFHLDAFGSNERLMAASSTLSASS